MQKVVRQSNLELLRIVAMLLIIAHHSIVNSGVNELFDFSDMPSARQMFCQWFGMWGKTAINMFVLFSGYFMCQSRLSVRRILKLFLQVEFYAVVMLVALWLLGYETFSLKRVLALFTWLVTEINCSFTPSFLLFYLFIPFYNALVNALDRRRMRLFTLGLVMSFVVPFTFFGNHEVFNWPVWYVAIYFTGACIRLHPFGWMKSNRVCLPLLLFWTAGAFLSGWLYDWNAVHACPFLVLKMIGTFFGIAESCSLTAWVLGVLFFLSFRNMKIPYSSFINAVASTTFGVLLIHAAGPAMCRFLWMSVVDVSGHYAAADGHFILHMFVSVVVIFAICSALDYLRIVFLERPFFRWLGRFVAGWDGKGIVHWPFRRDGVEGRAN